MQILESYLEGAWRAGDGDGAHLYDPTTEQPVAREVKYQM